MSETIREMVLPGTYIEVRAEGLIGVSGIAVGNLGVVGTAGMGPVDKVVLLGSYGEAVETFGAYDAWDPDASPPNLTLTRTLEQAFKGGASTVYAVRIAAGTPASARWLVQGPAPTGGGAKPDLFRLVATSSGTSADQMAKLQEESGKTVLKLELGNVKETLPAETAGELFDAAAGSELVRAETITTAALTTGERATAVDSLVVTGGSDGAAVGGTDVADGLALLAAEPVHIVVVGGLPSSEIADEVLAHPEATENDGRERIAVIGAPSDVLDDVKDAADGVANPRVILVAPGIVADDAASPAADKSVALPPAYAAALVAGRLPTLAPHVSLTNKDLAVGGLTRYYTRAQQKDLLGNRVLVLHRQFGMRVVQGITTDNAAFRQISVRRIVDYAKAGVRLGANPYIGRLNNPRVRGALQATLDGFLSGMVLDEMLQSYDLVVSATRAQEIAGQAIVTMTLRPTFSIDFIKVIMNLA